MKSAERQQRRGGGILHFLAVAERSKATSFERKDARKTINPHFLNEIESLSGRPVAFKTWWGH